MYPHKPVAGLRESASEGKCALLMHRMVRRRTTALKEDMKRVVCAIFAAMVSLGAVASTSILIAEENFEGAMSCRLASVGSFPVAPGIKSGMGVGGSCAYGFGRSSCNANAWDGYVNDLVFTFSKRYVITKVEFWEMERYDNWGSQGWLMAYRLKIRLLQDYHRMTELRIQLSGRGSLCCQM